MPVCTVPVCTLWARTPLSILHHCVCGVSGLRSVAVISDDALADAVASGGLTRGKVTPETCSTSSASMSTDRNPGCCNVTHTPRGCRVLQGNAHPGCCKVTHTLLSLVREGGRHSRTHPHQTTTCAESGLKEKRPLHTLGTHTYVCAPAHICK